MLSLRPYKPSDAHTIITWPKDEVDFRLWSADRYEKYPITADEMNHLYDSNDHLWAMTAFADATIVGHFTMRFPDSKTDELRLGFVIIDDKQRGKGYGKEMISLAIQYMFTFFNINKISLGVFAHNTAAISCYQACGFIPVAAEAPFHYQYLGQPWDCLVMELAKNQA